MMSQNSKELPFDAPKNTQRDTLCRPGFCSTITSDRLSEAARRPSLHLSTLKHDTGKERRSAFKELGLEDGEIDDILEKPSPTPPKMFQSSKHGYMSSLSPVDEKEKPWYSKLTRPSRPTINSASGAANTYSTIPRVAMVAFLLAIVIPGFRSVGHGGANARVIKRADSVNNGSILAARADSPTDTCTRWSHQSAVLNGTIYIYGGQSKSSPDQTQNTWNNNFLTLDLLNPWEKSAPALKGLPQPPGPPAVANGYLWHSFTSLFLYGGLYAENPPAIPDPVSLWEYNIPSSSWIEHANPVTTAGNNSDPGGVPVQRSAEGAGLSVPELGLSWYFGGHQDLYTTRGWSNQIGRIYLRSLLEFTHPGYMNSGVEGLGNGGKGAGTDGVFRNITDGGLQDSAGFTERADGVLVYVPGWGTSGIALGLAGGTADKYTEMNTIDIYDIASSTWYKQSTSGPSPSIRVNPCAVVFAAPDASSFNVYLYAGQNLQPYGDQTQYNDLWILTIPSFTWIKVNMDNQSNPPGRAGHSCHAWDGQMIVVGGYVGNEISCDSPGIYVFNASSLEWQNNFNVVAGSVAPSPMEPGGAGSGGQSGQSGQEDNDDSGAVYAGLAGSNGYMVPEAVQSVIGGGPFGSATATTPAAGTPTSGPIATGKPPVFTITQAGSTIIQTATATPTSNASSNEPANTSDGPNVGAIVAGTIAGLLALLAVYLAFCTWLYRRQLKLYKDHIAMSQRTVLGYSQTPDPHFGHPSEKGGVGGAIIGTFGTVIGHTSTNDSPERSSYTGSSAGGGMGGGVTRPVPAMDSSSLTGRLGQTDEGYWAGQSGEGSSIRASEGSTEDLLGAMEPSFMSVVMSPRRTLRVINRD